MSDQLDLPRDNRVENRSQTEIDNATDIPVKEHEEEKTQQNAKIDMDSSQDSN